MYPTTKPLVWRNHRSKNLSKFWGSGSVGSWGRAAVHVPGVQYIVLSTCSWGSADARVCPTSTLLCMATSSGGEGPRWDLGFEEIHRPLLHPLDCTYFAVSVSFILCHVAFCLPVSFWAPRIGQQGGWSVLYGQMQLCRRAVNSPIESRTLIFPISSTVNCCQGQLAI